MGLNNDTTTYQRLYYSDELGTTTSFYFYNNVIHYEVVETGDISKATYYYNGFDQPYKYYCPDSFSMIYSKKICANTFKKEEPVATDSSTGTSPSLKSLFRSQKIQSLLES